MNKPELKVRSPLSQDDEDYLRAKRVNSMHRAFMREVVVPSRKETT